VRVIANLSRDISSLLAKRGPTTAPLVVPLRLTDEQRELILQRTGLRVKTLPYSSEARALRCRFGGISLRVPRGVFVPAARTEDAFDVAREAARVFPTPTVVDVGTGSGAVALALAFALPDASVYATEVSEIAVRCARRNRARLELRNVRVLHGSLLEALPTRLRRHVAVIVGNVPYLPAHTAYAADQIFPRGTAVASGADGLDLVRELALTARAFLSPRASLILQLAEFQWAGLESELRGLGYAHVELARASTGGAVIASAIWPA
jgi:release factor glutamine methyltransferase